MQGKLASKWSSLNFQLQRAASMMTFSATRIWSER
jgi:hypothetical protein